MFKDVYLFINGIVSIFDERGNQVEGGTFSPELRDMILEHKDARITLARWKKGFFLLTREEFSAVEFKDDTLVLKFKRRSADETDSAD